MARAKKKLPEVALEDLTEAERVGRVILTDRNDLAPSVQRILTAVDLDGDQRHRAILLFQASLDGGGDPNRNPAVAIENGRAAAPAPGPVPLEATDAGSASQPEPEPVT